MIKKFSMTEFEKAFSNCVVQIEDPFAGAVSLSLSDFFNQRRAGIKIQKRGEVHIELDSKNIIEDNEICGRLVPRTDARTNKS